MSETPEDAPSARLEALRPARLKLAMIGFALGAVILVAVRAGLTLGLDETLLAALRLSGPAPQWRFEAVRDVTALGSVAVLSLAVLATTAFLLAKGWRGLSLAFLASEIGASAFSSAIKHLVDRGRPPAAEALVAAFDRSFPSGHALMSAAVLLTLGGFLALTVRQKAARRVVWVVAIGLALLVGLSRLMLGVHWPSDVLAGWLFGMGWALATLHYSARHWPDART